ncbi:MAG: hypothetical protein DRQ39_09725, partial [Gammaproteobacteria bacterium]
MANKNNINAWNANKHYKVGELVLHLLGTWRNDTGYNSEPGLTSDWFQVKEPVTPPSQSGLGTLEGAYTFSTLVGGDPGSGKVLLNNGDPLLATAVHISNTDDNGLVNDYHLLGLKTGDLIALNDKSTSKKYTYRLTDLTTNGVGYTTLPVQVIEVVGVFGDSDALVTEAIFTGSAEILRQKTINGNHTISNDDDKYFIYLELTANIIITVDSSVLVDGFTCEFENKSDFEAQFIGDIELTQSVNNPIYLTGDTINKDDRCELRRHADNVNIRLRGQLTFTGVVVDYEERVVNDGGIVGDLLCLFEYDDTALIDLLPSGYKSKNLYSIIPNTAAGDFAVTRGGIASFVSRGGIVEFAAIDVPRIDFTNGGCGVLLSELEAENTIQYSEDFENAWW